MLVPAPGALLPGAGLFPGVEPWVLPALVLLVLVLAAVVVGCSVQVARLSRRVSRVESRAALCRRVLMDEWGHYLGRCQVLGDHPPGECRVK